MELEYLFFLFFLFFSGLVSGIIIDSMLDDSITIGCWKIKNSDRNIKIRVNDRDLKEVIDTARHEVCHEIYYRINNWSEEKIDDNEKFAEECIPEDYLYLDNDLYLDD